MFENFSFSASSRPPRLAVDVDDRLTPDCDSTMISPMSSRCPSPQSHRFRTVSRTRSAYFRSHQPPPTSVPFPYDSKRLSISTLTQKLHEHTLQTPPGDSRADRPWLARDKYKSSPCVRHLLTPPDTDQDDDGFSLSSPSLCSNPSPTSMPPDFPLLDSTPELPDQLDHLSIRQQRQQISRLQCNTGDIDAIRRSVYCDDPFESCEDDCHPSSLPQRSSPRRRAISHNRSRFGPVDSSVAETRGRRKSSSAAVLSHRIEKNHHHFVGREASKRNEQGLRRQSVVTAALASVVEGP
ncbi:hypothetical protein N7468_006978 [Penicillium chermesinum]|uniref:Uncharacterized protein n=1 Tax=Penicillium chermesinum TaxID=63820 RepID=A0A9W9TK77_9EURO|nr:uncharacterized protein N7468_006978 [Penicillium chermesinum]KAJ5225753.1 hypothetical protein N7468_006978 [Penicillium chermesinum]